jgi:hypothetical protein
MNIFEKIIKKVFGKKKPTETKVVAGKPAHELIQETLKERMKIMEELNSKNPDLIEKEL